MMVEGVERNTEILRSAPKDLGGVWVGMLLAS